MGGGAPATEAENPLQLMVQIMVRQLCPCGPWRSRVEQISSCSSWRILECSRWMAEGGCDPVGSLCYTCAPVERGVHGGAGVFHRTCDALMDPYGSCLFMKDCLLCEGPIMEPGKNVRSPSPEEEGATETMCEELTTNPIPYPPVPFGSERAEKFGGI
ncbi:hypothetical protein WISP_87142 [Willisornis vidua]|uniref:Uncharacterized protein n=1 Tax=Willisornis vidua TaxID=1566151 RepID=A0ABQ9D8P6_9PASS|nr:hypothetical protein WISP_87142 [Willisornis vidua]